MTKVSSKLGKTKKFMNTRIFYIWKQFQQVSVLFCVITCYSAYQVIQRNKSSEVGHLHNELAKGN